jgi:hypothetical protein
LYPPQDLAVRTNDNIAGIDADSSEGFLDVTAGVVQTGQTYIKICPLNVSPP